MTTTVLLEVDPGFDETVVREAGGARREWTARGTMQDACRLVLGSIRETGATVVRVDHAGIGAVLAEALRDLGYRGEHRAAITS
jgi:hypothetical protein